MTDASNEELIARFVADHQPKAAGDDTFVAPTAVGESRLYGGALLSQAIVAALQTVGDKILHSLHAYFLAPGTPGSPVRYEVGRTRDGRTFCNRRIRATQPDRVLCEVIANFTVAQDAQLGGFQWPPPDTAAPDAAIDAYALLDQYLGVWMPPRNNPFEVRYVDPPPWVASARGETSWLMWLRPRAPLPNDAALHVAACVMMSDMRSNGTVERVFGLPLDPTQVISLDHAVWFHRPARMDGWLLIVTECAAAVAGRAHMSRRAYTRGGDILATVTQEMAYRDVRASAKR